jgi:hypothetical protein
MRRILVTAGALAALITGVACGAGSDPDGEGADVVESGAEGATNPPEEGDNAGAAAGTRENPLAPGVTFAVGDWTVQLGTTNPNADDVVAAENEFNEPPAEGRRFVMVEATVSYTGDDSGTPWIDLSFQFYGSGGNTFGVGLDDYCGVIPDGLEDHGEMFPDASATGNVCASVPADQVDGGAWIVEELLALETDRTFVALQ